MLGNLRSALPEPLQDYLASARELAHRQTETPVSAFSTTLHAFDNLLTGGLQRGQMTELIGERSSGRFSTVLATLAAATAAGEAAALVDLGDSLDPRLAAAAGIDLERLLWARPCHLKQALVSAEMLLTGGFPMVILDLGTPPIPGGRGVEAAWLRLARATQSHDAVLLVSSPYRVSGTAATGVVKATRGRPRWYGHGSAPRLLLGLSSRLTLEKLRHYQGERSETLRLISLEAAVFRSSAAVEPCSNESHIAPHLQASKPPRLQTSTAPLLHCSTAPSPPCPA